MVSSSEDDIIAKLGEDITLFCNATGFPEPKISWFRDQDSLSIGNGLELSLHNLTSESQGQYRCTASNLAGQTERVFSLGIEGKCSEFRVC